MTHSIKVLVFVYFGFTCSEYLDIIIVMAIGVVIGSYLGTTVRDKLDGKKLLLTIKILLSILAVKLIASLLPM